jgi:predicted 3-demethylubiquinone-9 3-methyltransferase (glyoxalase superfamily)
MTDVSPRTPESKIAPCLWFDGQAEAAAEFYTSLFPPAEIIAVSRYGEGSTFPPGTALMVEFTLAGQRFQALNGGPQFPHSEAISLSIDCADQAEVDHYWQALAAGGGAHGQCGWLKDRFGVSWQIVPRAMGQIMTRPDAAGRARAMQAMMKMTRLDVAVLEAAYQEGDR